MTFEEQFPSLKEYLGDQRVTCITLSEIQEHCLDKQRVKEDIGKYSKKYDVIKESDPSVWAMVKHDFEELLKELGLE